MRETTRKNTRFGGFSSEVDDEGLGENCDQKRLKTAKFVGVIGVGFSLSFRVLSLGTN